VALGGTLVDVAVGGRVGAAVVAVAVGGTSVNVAVGTNVAV